MKAPDFFISKIFVGQFAAFYIIVLDQIFVDCVGQVLRNMDLFAVGVDQRAAYKQLGVHLLRAVCQRLRQAGLQCLGKFSILQVGDQRQLVQLLHVSAQDAFVHALALLVDTQA